MNNYELKECGLIVWTREVIEGIAGIAVEWGGAAA